MHCHGDHTDPCLCQHCGALHLFQTTFKRLFIRPHGTSPKCILLHINGIFLLFDNYTNLKFKKQKKPALGIFWVKICLKLTVSHFSTLGTGFQIYFILRHSNSLHSLVNCLQLIYEPRWPFLISL